MRLRLEFSVASPAIDESALPAEKPENTALRLAQAKARAVIDEHVDALIIGSDQVAELGGAALGKPGNREAALAQLAAMSGQRVVFHTAVCVLDGRTGHVQTENVRTVVQMRSYSAAQAARYVDIDQPYDCAGSAKVESLGIALIERVDSSDPTALIGLPLIALVTMLARAGIDIP
jgi:septum formation protein